MSEWCSLDGLHAVQLISKLRKPEPPLHSETAHNIVCPKKSEKQFRGSVAVNIYTFIESQDSYLLFHSRVRGYDLFFRQVVAM